MKRHIQVSLVIPTYNLDIYLREKETLTHIIIFSFLGIIQLFFYTLGAFIVGLRLRDMPFHLEARINKRA